MMSWTGLGKTVKLGALYRIIWISLMILFVLLNGLRATGMNHYQEESTAVLLLVDSTLSTQLGVS